MGEGGCACGACGARCDDKDGAGGLAAVATTAEAATSPFLGAHQSISAGFAAQARHMRCQ